MSRVIVKNLPSGMKEARLREMFGGGGSITDCSMKYTKEGKFRKFAFIGYKTEDEANKVIKKLNKTFIDTSRIQVEMAKDLTDANKPRAWSKYSQDSSAFRKINAKEDPDDSMSSPSKKEDKGKKTKKGKNLVDDMLGDLKDDPAFHEFLDAHQSRSTKSLWTNDTTDGKGESRKVKGDSSDEEEGESGIEDNGSGEEEEKEDSDEDKTPKAAKKKGLSDLDYLKSKMSSSSKLVSDSEEEESMDEEEKKESEVPSEGESEEVQHKSKFQFVVKMRGLPTSIKEAQITEYFKPLKIKEVKIPRNAKGKNAFCIATVTFEDEKDIDAAMRRNKNFIGPKRIYLHKTKVERHKAPEIKPKLWEIKLAQKHEGEETEAIAESGRLYVRNLAYVCTEEDLEALFSPYGPLTETHLPIDGFTKKVKGFGFITFMIPEHAVKAYSELDGTTFQGRLLHILPAKAKKDDNEITDDMSFKKKKELKQKALAGSSHNWNSLFLGANAVADVMAEKYGTSKSALLDADQKQSLGVRMALGETQIISETRDFLIQHGVCLDVFSQAAAARSKTVILVKNLPAGTTSEEIKDVFEKHGTLGQVVLPPSGITAIVQYEHSAEAKKGFRNLAYTKFKHIPLYLEWAPLEIFGKNADKTDKAEEEGEKSTEDKKSEEKKEEKAGSESEEEEEKPEPGSTLFVKNLNFDTTDEALKEHFSKCGAVFSSSVSKKKDMKNPGQVLSMGYGFVEFLRKDTATKAIKTLQHSMLDGHQLELKVSNRATVQKAEIPGKKKQDPTKKQKKTTKILVRNIPFEAKHKEVRELFAVFGELKTVRLPKKMSGGSGSHRGFAFVDFLTRQDAKRAFTALCHSTHLYGRRLVLEWADTEADSVDSLRSKTAQQFGEGGPAKKFKKSHLLEDLKAMEEDK